ncbi:DUF6081 family protein [Actinomadura sp. B10D3]|uniref:DUF6081 family protein n=1 Tax=Actinomadura sp. B10D3 TaxID=3153557 RepID=UPI00325F14DE
MNDGVLYDELLGPGLDAARWEVLQFPLDDGGIWRLEEPEAKITVGGGTAEIRVDRYQRSHDTVQIFDNPKHLVATVDEFPVPRAGESVFSVQMAGHAIGGNPDDYRDAFFAFNVFDMRTATIFDHLVTGTRALVVHERLLVPGVVDPADAFTWLVEAPLSVGEIDTSRFHEYAVVLDPGARRVRWQVDGRLAHEARDVDVPESVRIGFGLFTLHQLRDGRSVSLRGQGMSGCWRELRVPA